MERKIKKSTYQCFELDPGDGMLFITDCCGNRMHSFDVNEMKYHGCLCPKCFLNNIDTILYLFGTKEADNLMKY